MQEEVVRALRPRRDVEKRVVVEVRAQEEAERSSQGGHHQGWKPVEEKYYCPQSEGAAAHDDVPPLLLHRVVDGDDAGALVGDVQRDAAEGLRQVFNSHQQGKP